MRFWLTLVFYCSYLAIAPAQATTTVVRPAEWAQPVPGVMVDNLYKVTPMLYRSAKLAPADVPLLQKLGIKKVISFRAFNKDDKLLAGSGIALQSVPIYTWYIREQELVTALKALRLAEKDGPILIHCQHGADRTGLVAALYRMVYQGWSREAAWEELENGGYGYHAIWKNIKRYIQNVDVDALRKKVE